MRRNILALGFYIAFLSSFFIFSKTLFNGFHWIDEDFVYVLTDEIQEKGLIQTMAHEIKLGLRDRFRPVFEVQKCLQAFFFGTNAFYHYLSSLGALILTSFLLFRFAVKIGIHYALALLFPLIMFLGTQCEIWYRLSPNEVPGMLFMSIALVLSSYAASSARPFWYEAGAMAAMILCSVSKESFVVMVPAMVIIYLWQIKERNPDEPVKNIIRRKLPFISILAAVNLAEVLFILKFVHVDKVGLPGLGEVTNNSFQNIVWALIELFYRYNTDYGFFIVILLGGLWMIRKKEGAGIKVVLLELLPILIVLLVILVPQLLLYMKSGMRDRYLVPSIVGVGLFVVYLCNRIFTLQNSNVIEFFLVSFICLMVVKKSFATMIPFKTFSGQCAAVNQFWSEIKQSTKPDSKILFVDDPVLVRGFDHCMSRYFNASMNNRKNYHFYIVTNKNIDQYNEFEKLLLERARISYRSKLYESGDILEFDLIGLPVSIERSLQGLNIPADAFRRQVIDGMWVIYHKK